MFERILLPKSLFLTVKKDAERLSCSSIINKYKTITFDPFVVFNINNVLQGGKNVSLVFSNLIQIIYVMEKLLPG